jgi:acyl-CoA thioester hydrolase
VVRGQVRRGDLEPVQFSRNQRRVSEDAEAGHGRGTAEHHYKQELVAGDVVEVRSRILEMRDKALRVEHEMHHANRDSAAAVMDQTAVHLDALTRKATPFPDEIRQRAVALIQK